MTAAPARATAPKWGLTIELSLVALGAATASGFVALLSGSEFAASEPTSPAQSLVMWVLPGLSLAAPIAALPSIGFSIRRRTAFVSAVAIVVIVALLGIFVLNKP
jgi:hypothetical protein